MSESLPPDQTPSSGSADTPTSTPGQRRVNPYVGPRALREGERIFGRDRELRELLNRLIADRLVLLYSPSGAGKSSLVQAGLIPQMRKEKFAVLPTVRVGLNPPDRGILKSTAQNSPQPQADRVAKREISTFNRYIFSCLLSLEQELQPEQQQILPELTVLTLQEYLDGRPRQPDEPLSRLLIFDQFEEILTQAPLDREGKLAFFDQLGETLLDHDLWALFVIREDFLAGLDPYLPLIPTYLRSTFRLDLLESKPALLAIQKPVEEQGIEFQNEAAKKLVDDLRRVWVQQPDGSQREEPGLYVEPVQLQVVCRRLYKELGFDQNLGKNTITSADVARLGDVNKALGEYYGGEVSEIASQRGIPERDIRDWFAERLITENLLRGQVLMGEGTSGGMDNGVIRQLEDAHLVRAENRRNSTWFELAHDRLVRPILEDNQAWAEAHLQEFQRRAAEWRKKDRPSGLLLRGRELLQAEEWAQANPTGMNAIDWELVEYSRQQRARHLNLAQRKASEWQQENRPPDLLLSETELSQAETWLREHPDEVTPLEMEYITASREAVGEEIRMRQERELQLEFERQRAKDQELQNQKLRRRNVWLAALAALALLVFLVALYFAYQFNSLASQNAARATEGAITAAANAQQRDINGTQAAQNAAERDANALKAAEVSRNLRNAQLTSDAQQAIAVTLATQSAENAQGRATAEYNAHLAQASRLGSLSQGNFGKDPPLSALLGIAAYQEFPDGWEGRNALLTSLQVNSQQQIKSYGVPIPSQINILQDISFSPDGRLLAWSGLSGKLRVWNLEQNKLVRELQIFPNHGVNSLSFSPVDGNLLVGGSGNGYLTFWNLESGEGDPKEAVYRTPAGVRYTTGRPLSLAFNPAGNLLAVGGINGNVQIWDVTKREPIFIIDTGSVTIRKLDWSPEGDRLAGAAYDINGGIVYIWDPTNGDKLDLLTSDDELVYTLDWSPDGEWLAFAGGGRNNRFYPHIIRLHNTHTRQQIKITAQSYNIRTLAFDQDSKVLAAGSDDGTLRLWDVSLASVSGSVQSIGETSDKFITRPPVQGLTFSPHGPNRLAYFTDDGRVTVYTIGLSQPLNTEVVPASISADSLVSSGLLSVSEAPGGELLNITQQDGKLFIGTNGSSERINPDIGELSSVSLGSGGLLAVANRQGHIEVWDIRLGQSIWQLDTPGYQPVSLALSPDGTLLAVSECERSESLFECDGMARVQVYEIGSDEKRVGSFSDQSLKVSSLAFSQGNRFLAGGAQSGEIIIWDYQSGDKGHAIIWDEPARVTALAFSPDGQTLASGSQNGNLALWDVATYQQIGQTIRSVNVPITGLLFASNGLSLVSAGQDGSIQRWDLNPESWIERLCQLAGPDFPSEELEAFSPGQKVTKICAAYIKQPTETPSP